MAEAAEATTATLAEGERVRGGGGSDSTAHPSLPTPHNNNFIYVYKYARERRGLDQQINRRVRSKSQYEFPPLFLKNTSGECFNYWVCFG